MVLQRRAPSTLRRHSLRTLLRVAVLTSGDLAAFAGTRLAFRAARDSGLFGSRVSDFLAWAVPRGSFPGWPFVAALLLGLTIAGAYRPGDCRRDSGRLLAGVALAGGLVLWRDLWVRGYVPVGVTYVGIVAGLTAALILMRLLIDRVAARVLPMVRPAEKVLFVGDPNDQESVRTAARLSYSEHMSCAGWVTVAKPHEGGPAENGGNGKSAPHHADDIAPFFSPNGEWEGFVPADFWRILRDVHVDTVVLCGPVVGQVFDVIVEACAAAGCRLLSASRYAGVGRLRTSLVWYHRLPFMELTLPSLRGQQLMFKRVFDFVCAVVGLAVLSPLFALIALAIKVDSKGRIFFTQERVGMGGRIFRLTKFRTMRDGADLLKVDLAHLNHTGDPRLFKIPNDPRVTRVGACLRKWSLDELPQLVSVLRGEMSLVGPRPFFESDLETYSDHHFARLGAKPGITGLWQISGRSAVSDFEEVVRLDSEYIDKWSLWLDFKILLRTLPAVLWRTGAY